MLDGYLSHTPESCQRLLFSATMPKDVINIVNDYLREPCKVQIKTKTATAATIEQKYLVIKGFNKNEALDRILEIEDTDGVMIFVRTKSATIEVADALKFCGHKAAAINGDMQQNQREYIIDQLRKSKIDILVATDVVARGLDVERISHVVNYDLPMDNDSYVHRIGRTGRAGRTGAAIALVHLKEMRSLRMLERFTRSAMKEIQLPTTSDIQSKRAKSFKHELAETIRHKNLETYKKIISEFTEEYGEDTEATMAALLFMCQKEKPLIVRDLKIRKEKVADRQTRNFNDRSNNNSRGNNARHDRSHEQGSRARYQKRSNDDMSVFRIEVGKKDGVEPRNIVGAIANEGGISSSSIGQIKLHDSYSTVCLPRNINNSTISHLKKVWISGKKMDIKIES